jgi:hypothetical protein
MRISRSINCCSKRKANQGRKDWKQTLLSRVPIHRIYCSECKNITIENLSFLSSSKARITRSLERTIIELRPKMSITDVTSFFDIDWKTVKECEKKV